MWLAEMLTRATEPEDPEERERFYEGWYWLRPWAWPKERERIRSARRREEAAYGAGPGWRGQPPADPPGQGPRHRR